MIKRWGVFIVAFIVIALSGGYFWLKNQNQPTTLPVPTAPELTYPGAYNGLIYTTSEKLGSEFDLDSYMEGLNRNGIAQTIIYFGVESAGDGRAVEKAVSRYPGRIIPFYSTGIGGQGEGAMVGSKLTEAYSEGFNHIEERIGSGTIKGIGEVEIVAWPVPHNDPKVQELMAFAEEKKMAVMLHPKLGKIGELTDLVAKFPRTKFLIHLFRNDFTKDKQQVIALMKAHQNVLFTIDADHLMFSERDKIGLLYKYQDEDIEEGVEGFIADFESMFTGLLDKSVADYRDLVTMFPTRITVGTEMSTDYSEQPEVFDRTIKFLRHFIGKMPAEHQEALAFRNAELHFGKGIQVTP
jgi:hypothetical protein